MSPSISLKTLQLKVYIKRKMVYEIVFGRELDDVLFKLMFK